MKPSYMKKIIGLFIMALLLVAGCTTTGTQTTQKVEDTSWMFEDIVDAAFVKNHVSVPMATSVMIIDARPYKPKYTKGHIPGAVSIPFSKFDKKKNLLPKDKNTLLIYYCGGLKCKLSHKSAKKAQKLGYKNVKVFAKGFPERLKQKGNYASVTAEYVAAKIAENKTLIVDARPQKTKFVKGHIPTAVNIPFSQFNDLKGKLPRDLNTPVIFYCGGLKCKLSHKSAAKAIEMGYTDVAVFAKGYPEWKKNFGASGQTVQVKAGEAEGSIDLERFKKIIAKHPESIHLIDVRDADEFAKGSFNTAENIPVEKLEPEIKKFNADKPIVFVCSTGARSGEAFYMVQDIKPSLKNVYYVEAQIDFKSNGTYEIKKPN
ncbi:MAG: sulfurtransferase [Desulfobacteraceae bacterium]|nr:sulfurtransferase [Desulfobacteraceae bacterium]